MFFRYIEHVQHHGNSNEDRAICKVHSWTDPTQTSQQVIVWNWCELTQRRLKSKSITRSVSLFVLHSLSSSLINCSGLYLEGSVEALSFCDMTFCEMIIYELTHLWLNHSRWLAIYSPTPLYPSSDAILGPRHPASIYVRGLWKSGFSITIWRPYQRKHAHLEVPQNITMKAWER